MPPRKNRHAKAGKSKKKTLLWTLAIILLLIIGGLVYYFTAIYNQLDNLHKTGEDSPFVNVPTASAETVQPPEWEGTEPVNILLMGVDARGVKKGEVPRSDTMLVASLDPVKKNSMCSLFFAILISLSLTTGHSGSMLQLPMDPIRRCRR